MSSRKVRIAAIAGDGIGTEVVAEGLKVLDAVVGISGMTFLCATRLLAAWLVLPFMYIAAVGAGACCGAGPPSTGAAGHISTPASVRIVIMLPGCGHWTQQERPDEVNALLVDWLKRL